ncbi:metalloregulator ArsR/SmtB family transcription factor [Gilvimarinus sp. SDUM040013]|uniref:Metalloregulator ArsR/SmtB family transcription factor n=1 Tax=Gilvimarinus gilvus TaxID=3058038 RepID=A0ABU4RY82_9GAMM|nr:metalloregulator ArsR/SmtB family transcription factor [Gilvimarinus sp. SDUM040013]MDO3388540.1 metalloregulator ArsR/SmtB family transcription factor [Gilvimarinus sp. SDUM040013]MDX6848588.1 metalloregulator ArsR/SmtB family transcription factor [Gilvimarinus sp. SDUM040013]
MTQALTANAANDTPAADATASACDTLACLLKAAGDPLRLQILAILAQNSFGVSELARIFDVRQSGMSHHLKLLTAAGLTSSRREGNSIYYRRAMVLPEQPYAALQLSLFQSVDQLSSDPAVAGQCRAIAEERAQASQQFFADNAHKFRAQQDLIASYSVYGEQVAQLLSNTPFRSRHLALEVGPGQGEFLPALAKRFAHVVALDSAEAMLEHSREAAAKAKLNNVEFIHGDTSCLPQHRVLADGIVMNMVLHHTPSPADIFKDLSQALTPGGALIVTELCRHEQDWARENCGDLWQGFEPADLTQWASDAGLEDGQSMYIALRNGFQVQLRQFIKQL